MIQFFHALVVMNSLFAASAWCLSRPTLLSCGAVVVSSVLWLFLNGPLEGRVLLVLTPRNGITESDLLSVVGVAIAVVGLIRVHRSTATSARQGPAGP